MRTGGPRSMVSQERIPRIIETMAAGAALALAAVVAFGDVPSSRDWEAAVFFTAFGIVATALSYHATGGGRGSTGFLPFLGVAILTPNIAAVVSVTASIVVSEFVARRPIHKIIYNVSHVVWAFSVAVIVFWALGGEAALATGRPSIAAALGMAAVFFCLNKLAVSTVIALSTRTSTLQHWIRSLRASALYDILSLPLILFLATVYARGGWQLATAFVVPVMVMRQLYKTTSALQKVNEELLQLMVASIEARDPYTSGHSQRVARFAAAIARSLNLSGRQVERIATAALLHDVGKIHEEFAPILRKPGRLTDDEFAVMKTHSAKSAALVAKVSHFVDLVPMVQSHHEAWDGRGYPEGIAGSEIPLGARIIAIADTIDAMTTSRPYRRSMTVDEVRDELVRESGHQFDPMICRKLLNDVAWRGVTREIAAAQAEYPVSPDVAIGGQSSAERRLLLTS